MTQDEIVRMAREAGFSISAERYLAAHQCTTADIERFAAIVAAHANQPQVCCQDFEKCDDWCCVPKAIAHEREACAKVCDDLHHWAASCCAKDIRARGEE